jgi:hypothetical protein
MRRLGLSSLQYLLSVGLAVQLECKGWPPEDSPSPCVTHCYGSAGPSVNLCVSEAKSTVGVTPGLVSGVESGVLGSECQRSGCPGSQGIGAVIEAKFGRLLTKSSLGLNWYYWFSLYTSESICLVSRSSVIVARYQSSQSAKW